MIDSRLGKNEMNFENLSGPQFVRKVKQGKNCKCNDKQRGHLECTLKPIKEN